MSKYTLPELSYDYAALEPSISARIMELHHSKHHAAYVANLNAQLEDNPALDGLSLDALQARTGLATAELQARLLEGAEGSPAVLEHLAACDQELQTMLSLDGSLQAFQQRWLEAQEG